MPHYVVSFTFVLDDKGSRGESESESACVSIAFEVDRSDR